jgi:hypothetical protein
MRPENPGSQVVLLRLRGSSACRFVVNQMLTGISDLSEGYFVKRPPRSIVFLLKIFMKIFFRSLVLMFLFLLQGFGYNTL